MIDLSKNLRQAQYFNEVMRAVAGESENRFFGYGGAIRGGKSFVTLFILILLCKKYPKSKWHVVRKDMPVLLATTIPSLRKLLPNGVIEHRDRSNYRFEFQNGSQIVFKAENITGDKLLDDFGGLETNGFFLEQVEELDEFMWNRAIERTGSLYIDPMPKGFVFVTFNPTDKWPRKKFYEPHRAGTLNPPYFYLEALPTDNPFVTEDQWSSWREMDPIQYRKMVEGDWDAKRSTNEFYHGFSRVRHEYVKPFNPNLPIHSTYDQNVVPYVTNCLWQVEVEKNGGLWLHQFDEICLESPRNTTQHLCTEFKAMYGDDCSALFFYGDASGRKRDTRGQDDDYKIIKSALAAFLNNNSDRVAKANAGIIRRREFINAIFNGQIEGVRITISPKCTKTIEDYANLKQDANGEKLKEMGRDRESGASFQKYGHTSDANDYFICTILDQKFKAFCARQRLILHGG